MTAKLANAYNENWAFYGATGVTGRMVLAKAMARGHRPLLIGRDLERLNALGAPLGLRSVEAALDKPGELAMALNGVTLLLNSAGPFIQTARPLMDAALRARVDYVDLNGELSVLEHLLCQKSRAIENGVVLVGGAGFGVTLGEGLAVQTADRLGGVDWLRLSVAIDSAFSSQSVAESTLEAVEGGGFEVEDNRLVHRPLGRVRWRELGKSGQSLAFASAPLAEISAIRSSLGAARIIAGVPMPATQARLLSLAAPLLPTLLKFPAVRRAMSSAGGHNAREPANSRHTSRVWVEARSGARILRAHLEAGEGFAVAADTAILALESILRNRPRVGAHTPASAFGANFIDAVPGVRIAFENPRSAQLQYA